MSIRVEGTLHYAGAGMPNTKPIWGRIATLGALGFMALASYGFVRPAVESMFLGSYGSAYLPYVWIAVGGAVLLVVAVYNHFATTTHPAILFGAATVVSALSLVALLVARHAGVRGADFVLYIWKDVYIVVLVEVFWTYANMIVPVKTARWLYGGFLLCGTVGSVAAELTVGVIAERWGTMTALTMVLPLFVVLAVVCGFAARAFPIEEVPEKREAKPGVLSAFSVLRSSRYVMILLALVAVVQVAITLVDYQFNHEVAEAFSDQDRRTQVIGQIYATINIAAFALQLGCGLILRYVGVPITLLALPVILGATVLVGMVSPRFLTTAIAKVVSKAFDYSLFRAAKEILYIPLTTDEKTRGKAVVDIFGYRVAKAGASLLILVVLGAGTYGVGPAILVCAVIWYALTRILVQKHVKLTVDMSDAPR